MKKPHLDQLDLFAAPPPAPPKREELTRGDLVIGPISPTTGGGLNAIEAARVGAGLSIANAGFLICGDGWEEARCRECTRYIQAHYGSPLYAAVSTAGDEPGEEFKCGQCGVKFVAHRDENAMLRHYQRIAEERRRDATRSARAQ